MGSWMSSTLVKPANWAALVVAALCGSSNSAGTEITACSGRKPYWSLTSLRRERSTSADSSSGSRASLAAGKSSLVAVPIRRLNSARVFFGSLSRNFAALAPTVSAPRLS